MTTAHDLTLQLINRARNLREFVIKRPLPDDFEFRGQVPYTLRISDDIITLHIHAIDEDEANQLASQFLEGY